MIMVSLWSISQAQTYTLQELEAHFLQNNYLLVASKYKVDQEESRIIQEKLWNNPTVRIGEVNLWKNPSYEKLPYLFGQYGQAQQISVELEQLVETAGKRRKRVAVQSLEKNSALLDYEELMRELKKELRQSFHVLDRIKQEETQLNSIVQLFEQLYQQYERQSQRQHVAKTDYYRIQSELIGLHKEKLEVQGEKAEELHKLRLLTQLPDLTVGQLHFVQQVTDLSAVLPVGLIDLALEQNIGLKRQNNLLNKTVMQLDVEKAQRVPDLTFQLNYDRGGNIMRDFVGVGVSFDLPVFNTNKGNIKAAQYTIEQEKSHQKYLQWELKNEVIRLQSQLRNYESSLVKWNAKQTEEQSILLENYKKQLQNKQVTLLEFIDFAKSFHESQKAYWTLFQDYKNTYEELQYIVGKDF